MRLGIAGSGGMAEYQVKKFRALPDCAITACKDHKRVHAAEFALRFGIPEYFDRIEALLESGCADAVSCAVVDSRHADVCMTALEYGKAVFCEKPFTRTLEEARTLAAAAGKSAVPTCINFSKRNTPALQALRRLVQLKPIGEPLSVEAEYLQSWTANGMWGDWRTVPRWKWRLLPGVSTAGVVGDLGSHVIDALLFLFDDLQLHTIDRAVNLADAAERGLLGRRDLEQEFTADPGPVWVDITAAGTLPFNTPVRVRISTIEPDAVDDFTITVIGTEGKASLDLKRSRNSIFVSLSGNNETLPMAGPEVRGTYGDFIRMVDQWMRRDPKLSELPIHQDEIPQPDFTHGLKVQELLDRLAPGGLPK